MTLPPLARVRQSIPQPQVEDVPGTVRRLMRESRIRERVPAGGTVAVGIGSRGINGIATMARATVDALKEMGYRPFVVAAMGSHGGATADGQRALLAGYGVTTESMGVPVKTDMDTVVLGHQPGRPADLLRQERPRGRRHRPGQPGQAAHRLPRDPRVGRAEDAGHRPGQARRGQPGAQAGPPRDEGGPAGRRQVPGPEHEVRARAGDPRECRRRPRRDRPGRAGNHPRRRAEAARAGPRADGPAAVRPDRRPGRRRAGQELLGGRDGPERDRPADGRDPVRLRQAPGHAAGRARRLGREPRQHRRRRLRRPDHRAARLAAGPRAVPDQRPDLVLPRAGADPDHLADRPRRDRDSRSRPAGGSTRRRPGW